MLFEVVRRYGWLPATTRLMASRRSALTTKADATPFPFTEEEPFAAFKLVSGEDAARENARMVMEQVAGAPNWETTPETRALLSLGSDSAAERVAAIRQQMRPDRAAWLAMEMHLAGLSANSEPPAFLEAQWGALREADERAWQETLAGIAARQPRAPGA